jgi:hypothetical protein
MTATTTINRFFISALSPVKPLDGAAVAAPWQVYDISVAGPFIIRRPERRT